MHHSAASTFTRLGGPGGENGAEAVIGTTRARPMIKNCSIGKLVVSVFKNPRGRRRVEFPAILFSIVAVLQATEARADPGEGLSLGPAKVSPYVGVSGAFDSNVLQASADEIANAGGDSVDLSLLALDVNPGLSGLLSNDKVELRLGYDHYLRTYAVEKGLRRSLSYGDNFAARATAEILPKSMFGLTVREYARNHSTINQSANSYLEQSPEPDVEIGEGLYYRFFNDTGVRLRYSPGAALDFYLGGGWFYERLSASDSLTIDQTTGVAGTGGGFTVLGDKNDFGADLRGRWKFFPRTYLVMESEYHRIHYDFPSSDVPQRDLNEWVVRAGVSGQFTSTIQAVGMVGYGQLRNTDESLDSLTGAQGLVGQASVSWEPQRTQSLGFSFIRSFGDFLVADYYINNSVAFRYQGNFYDGRLETNAAMLIDLRNLDLLLSDLEDETNRNDQRYRFRVGAAYRIMPWLRATTSYTLTLLDSTQNRLDYNQHLLLVGVRASY